MYIYIYDESINCTNIKNTNKNYHRYLRIIITQNELINFFCRFFYLAFVCYATFIVNFYFKYYTLKKIIL